MVLAHNLKAAVAFSFCLLLIACSSMDPDTVVTLADQMSGQPTSSIPDNTELFTPPPDVLNKLTWADFSPEMEVSQSLQASLWYRIQKGLSFEVNPNQPDVARYIRYYRTYPDQILILGERAAPFLYFIVENVEQRGMPMEMALLPIVESAFDPFSLSHAGATGIWQIMPTTGNRFGLKQDWWFDGRRDIPGSTEVALNYLQTLHDLFQGDWLLALAAYNSGEGTVKKAMMQNRRIGKKADFFSLDLPKQTRNYVPKMLALSYVVKHANDFKVRLPNTENQAFLKQVTLKKQIDLALAAELAQIDLKALYHYNPGYTRWATHPKGPHHLLLPIKNAKLLEKSLSTLNDSSLTKWHRYQVKNGDTVATIAALYRTTSAAIKEANNLKKESVRVGQYLLIPGGNSRATVNFKQAFERKPSNSKTTSTKTTASNASEKTHTVQKGDSLWSISKQYGISLQKLMQLNQMSSEQSLKPGQRLLLSPHG